MKLNEIIKGDSIFCATAITDTMNLLRCGNLKIIIII